VVGCLPRAGAFGSSGAIAASSLASAARSGSRRGACGYRSPSMTPRIAAVTTASSSSGRSIVGTAGTLGADNCPARKDAPRGVLAGCGDPSR
jgi:hypothetical protein